MTSRISQALRAKLGEELGDYDDAICAKLEQLRPDIVDRIVKRIETEAATTERFGEIYVDVAIAFDATSKGAELYPEPAIDARGGLQLRPPIGAEKKSDYAVKPPTENPRWVNVEAKTPRRDDRRGGTNYGLYEDEFEKGVKRLWKKGLEPVSVGLHARDGILKFKGGDVGRVISHILRELEKFVNEGPPAAGLSSRDVQFEGEQVGAILKGPTRGEIMKGSSLGGHPFNPADYVDRGQLAEDAPNVIWINLDRELLPLPDVVISEFENAFAAGKFRDVSGVLVFNGNRQREFVVNEKANLRLKPDEVEFLRQPFTPPQEPKPRRPLAARA